MCSLSVQGKLATNIVLRSVFGALTTHDGCRFQCVQVCLDCVTDCYSCDWCVIGAPPAGGHGASVIVLIDCANATAGPIVGAFTGATAANMPDCTADLMQ